MTRIIDELMDLWKEMIPSYVPPRSQFALWLSLHGAEIVNYGIKATCKKYINLNCQMSPEHLARYASSVMTNRSKAVVQ